MRLFNFFKSKKNVITNETTSAKSKTVITSKENDFSYTDERDGHVYKIVKIGKQIWMAENLAYKASSGCLVYGNVSKYGYLYTWETAMNVCPKGWHLPSKQEFEILVTYLGGKDVAGGKLKSKTVWKSPNKCATNSSGFSALAGGSTFLGKPWHIDEEGSWWSSSMEKTDVASSFALQYDTGDANIWGNSMSFHSSVRCLRDEPSSLIKSDNNNNERDLSEKLDPIALINAIKSNNIDTMRTLIAQGVDVNFKQCDGGTALLFASGIGNVECIKELIAHGADVNVKYNNGMTPLMYASMRNHPQIVRMLCEKNVDINAKDDEGWSALNKAAGKGFIDCVNILLEKGADPNTKDNDGQSALMSAASEGHLEIVKQLMQKGANCGAKDNYNVDALMYAAKYGHTSCAKLIETSMKNRF